MRFANFVIFGTNRFDVLILKNPFFLEFLCSRIMKNDKKISVKHITILHCLKING